MLELIAFGLFVLWVVGLILSFTMGGLIHVLAIAAIVVLDFSLLQGRGL